MRVDQLMTRTIHTCAPHDCLSRAMQLMWEHDCGCIPVVDAEQKLVGIVTDRDLAMAAYIQGKSISEIRVGDVMANHVQICGSDEEVTIALERMRRYQLRRLPVTDANSHLVGLVSLNDLALEALGEGEPGCHAVQPADIAETLAEVCKHRAHRLVIGA